VRGAIGSRRDWSQASVAWLIETFEDLELVVDRAAFVVFDLELLGN
jgi:hypothetical protein